ncbi:MAG: hypothetical protein HN778_06465 [Prolixibacteraceae bacterium]|jgi:hypothetical protein|nr:hypothetical protein [Prolixibacteraceae bacterium]MBT6005012.1 hypothetical protein [Prolixibacteraceae bacterium]MBT6764878.1 hypothetical protein [Prolixibacteraceae bacterium]MBT6999042.1 hypothetical protein [Prolixibacteraceae bacterium]MBT7394459.1 hypothetical protein [Prolixibacteraceae bacterium]
MKKNLSRLIVLLIIGITFNQCKTNNSYGITVQGNVKNSNQDYVLLSYSPRYRGNPSFEGFKNIGLQITPEGQFKLSTKKITDGAEYALLFKKSHIKLQLFEGDNILLDFDIDKPNETLFASGRGAAKINILNLAQFKREFLSDLNFSLTEYVKYSDSIASLQQEILQSIYEKKPNSDCIKTATNSYKIEKIINENELTQKEYDYVKLVIYVQKLSLSSYIPYLSRLNQPDSAQLDFNGKLFSDFSLQNYKKIINLNSWRLGNGLEKIQKLEYLKHLQNSGEKICPANCNSFLETREFLEWKIDFTKENFNDNVFNMSVAGEQSSAMYSGIDYKEIYEYFGNIITQAKYLNWVNNFKSLLDSGLNNTNYNLASEELTLDKRKFEQLVTNNSDKPILFVFWSARHAGASVIENLPALNDFEKSYGNEINVIKICLDNAEHKNLWAARIIENSWKGNHYFMPFEDNDSSLKAFTTKNISSHCTGGVNYALRKSDGSIINNVDSPLRLLNGDTDEYLKEFVR